MKDLLLSVRLLLLTTHTCLAEEEETRSLPPLTDSQLGPCSRSRHLKLPPLISLRLLAISAASPLPLHSSFSFHCQFAPPWAFFGTLGFVSSIRLGRPNFIPYRIPLVGIHTHTHTQIGNLRRERTCPSASRVSLSRWCPACTQKQVQRSNSSSISMTINDISQLNLRFLFITEARTS